MQMNHVCGSHSKYFASIVDREVVGSSPTGTVDCDTHSKKQVNLLINRGVDSPT